MSTYPSSTRYRFGGGLQGEARHAADIPVGAAESKAKFTACVPDADIPALLRKGALEKLGAQLDFPRDLLTLNNQGVRIPLRLNRIGPYILSAVNFEKDPSRKARGPAVSASYYEWVLTNRRPNLSTGGLQLPYKGDGLSQFEPPRTFPA